MRVRFQDKAADTTTALCDKERGIHLACLNGKLVHSYAASGSRACDEL